MAKKLPVRKDGSPSNRGANFRDPAFQREMRSRVSSESCAANGSKGFQATVKKFGRDFGLKVLATWRRAHPTALERQVMQWLDEFQMAYEREKQIGRVFCDFVIEDIKLVIECDGRPWHSNHPLHGEDRVSRDRDKDRLLKRHGYSVLRLPEGAIRNGAAKDDLDRAITRRVLDR